MITASVHEAKTHLSRYLKLAGGGEEVVILRRGEAVARLVGMAPKQKKRVGGRLRGEFSVDDDFYAADPEIDSMFSE